MKIDRVFLAFFKKDGEEHLLYKQHKNLYIDLNTKEKFTEEDIDLRTLILFKDSINCDADNYLKCFIKLMYKGDRKELLNIEKLCIVNICKAIDVEREYVNKFRIIRTWVPKYVSTSLLEEKHGDYYDIRNSNKYKDKDDWSMQENSLYIQPIKYLSEIFPFKKSIEKGKVLKLQYDVINGKDMN